MKRFLISLSFSLIVLGFQAQAEIEFLYGIKEKVFDQQGNTQPIEPTEWNFGAGASGDDQLTAVSVTLPGDNSATSILNDDGFDLDPDPFATKADLDAAYPNGSLSLSITDGGESQDLGPFSIEGDAYPIAPHITNALELQASDYSQDFPLAWNAFTGADEADQIIIQIWDSNADTEVVFEFLPASDTSYTIPGNTFVENNYYEVEIIFVNETDGLDTPETIIGYLSTTSYLLSTHTSDTTLQFYKWQRNQQVASDTVQVDGYQMISLVTGDTKAVSAAAISNETSNPALNSIGNNTHRLFTQFNSKGELDSAYPPGEYRFSVTEDNVSTNYGAFILPGDAYPTAPQLENFTELLNFDATTEQNISWGANPAGISLVQVRVINQENSVVWSQDLDEPGTTTSVALPGGALNQDENYSMFVRFWMPAITNDKPPTELGYLTSTFLNFQTSAGGGGDPGIDFAYTIKEKLFEQTDNAGPTEPVEWGFGAGVQGGNDVTGGSLDHPGGNIVFIGEPGEYDTDDLEYASQAALDAAFPNGSYTLNITVDGSDEQLGPFTISGDDYPAAPRILNLEEFQANDPAQSFTLNWNAFSGADADDRILIIGNNRSEDGDLIFEFLDATATSYDIPGGTLSLENGYEFELLFIKDTDGLETPDTIIGYISGTTFEVSTFTSDTDLIFYKVQSNLQTAPDELQAEGYKPLAFVIGQSNTVTYAEINSQSESAALNFFTANSYILSPPLDTKEALDASYPPGYYQFYIEENQSFIGYGDYQLPGDAYPTAPQFSNYDELKGFDSTQEQTIGWSVAPEGVTTVSIQIRNQLNQTIWSETYDSAPTSTVIPADTLDPFTDYNLFIRFWARQSGSDFPDASLGYLSLTHMPIQTFAEAGDYATWQLQLFTEGEILDPEIAGPDADPDGDKLDNRFEFLAKLNPVDGSSTIRYVFSTVPSEQLTISPLFEGVNWELQSSPDLQTWTAVSAETYEVVGNEVRVDLESFLPNTFFQIVLDEGG